ncbi:MAG: hypothetical protein U5N86_00250 [Planctomycetota bacterium]|nr:hypothetical protein [Planctomycetota bacterium]
MSHSRLIHDRLSVFIICSMLLLVIPSSIGAEEEKDYCNRCHNTGKVECDEHGGDWEHPPYKSSVIIEAECGCCGLGWLPCPEEDCPKRPAALEEFKRKTDMLKAWLQARRAKVDAKILTDKYPKLKKTKPLHAETDHCINIPAPSRTG